MGGTIQLVKEELKKPLQWFICQLHANELPLRHLMEYLDGVTAGPRVFAGVIGKSLSTCEQLPIVAFEPIESNDISVTVADLSTGLRPVARQRDKLSNESLQRRHYVR